MDKDLLVSKDETPRITFLRRIIVFVIVVFVGSIGIPLWFNTTTIYRAELPSYEVNYLIENLHNKLKFSIPVYLEFNENTLQQQEIEERISNAQVAVNNKLYHENPSLQGFWSINLLPKQNNYNPLDDYLIELTKSEQETLESFSISRYGKNSTLYYTNDVDTSDRITHILINELFKSEIETMSSIINNEKHHLDELNSLALPYSSNYNIVFSLFTESGEPINWDISKVSKLFDPIFEQLNHFSKFSISSQVQYYSTLTSKPERDEEKKTLVVKKDDLSTFINFEDWNLISHEINPTINFIVYFPKSNYEGYKLKIEDSEKNSFLVPKWGGVYIFNKDMPLVTGHGSTNIVESELLPIMEVFLLQLFKLIGMPQQQQQNSINIKIDILSRISIFKNLKQSLENLNSLVKLTEALNEISIPELTKEHVEETLSNIESSIDAALSSDFKSSVEYSAKSVSLSNKAFFEKEMVQQAYFPQEHRLAVFLPLLGPICSILFLGVVKTVKDMKANRKQKTE